MDNIWRQHFYQECEFSLRKSINGVLSVFLGSDSLHIKRAKWSVTYILGKQQKSYHWSVYDDDSTLLSTFYIYTEREAIEFACQTLLKREKENKEMVYTIKHVYKGQNYTLFLESIKQVRVASESGKYACIVWLNNHWQAPSFDSDGVYNEFYTYNYMEALTETFNFLAVSEGREAEKRKEKKMIDERNNIKNKITELLDKL